MCFVLQEGIHTADLKSDLTTQLVGTKDFASAVIERLGKKPSKLTPVCVLCFFFCLLFDENNGRLIT